MIKYDPNKFQACSFLFFKKILGSGVKWELKNGATVSWNDTMLTREHEGKDWNLRWAAKLKKKKLEKWVEFPEIKKSLKLLKLLNNKSNTVKEFDKTWR